MKFFVPLLIAPLLVSSAHAAFQLPPILGGSIGDTGSDGSDGGSINSTPGNNGGGSWSGPGDTVGGGGSTGGGTVAPTGPTSGAPTPAGNPGGAGAHPGPTGGSPRGSTATGGAAGATLGKDADDAWWLWWEYNKTEFLRPNRLGMWSIAATGDGMAEIWSQYLRVTRTELATAFAITLDDPDANVRRASVDALGKLAGEKGVPHLVRMLADKSIEVRHHAILALGATGSVEALPVLRNLATHGAVKEGGERVSTIAPAVAIVALGLARRSGLDTDLDEFVAERVKARTKNDRESIGSAAMLYQRLAPSADLESIALALAADHDEAPSVRCRAIEALSTARTPKALAQLQAHLTGSRLDERRSAALALGAIADPLALPALQSACELEAEPLTRGFALVSIGRRGGDAAREYLLKTIAKDDRGDRHWAALALGVLGRNDPSPSIRAAIRTALEHEKNRALIGAYWLALGLSRDLEGRATLRAALASGADPRQRLYAATGLALVGDPESASLVRESLGVEQNSTLKVAYGAALGQFGMVQDAERLASVLADLKEPALQGLAASALAFHGTREALGTLRAAANEDKRAPVRRAAAIEGLAMMLGETPPYTFSVVSRQANYMVFNDWMKGLLQVSL